MRIYNAKNSTYNVKGYTILEMLVTTAVFSLCIALITSTMIYGVNFHKKTTDKIETKAQFLDAFNILRQDIKYFVPNASPFMPTISSDTNKTARWTTYFNGKQHEVQYSIASGDLIRLVDGKASTILQQGEVDFEVKFLQPNLGFISLWYKGEKLSSHVRPRLLY